jgi:hypothetical protein
MNEQQHKKIEGLIFEIYNNRNQQPLKALVVSWMNRLSKYDLDRAISVLNWYVENGDSYPDFTKIIAKIKGKKDSLLEANKIMEMIYDASYYKSSWKDLPEQIKSIARECCSGGMSRYKEMNEKMREDLKYRIKDKIDNLQNSNHSEIPNSSKQIQSSSPKQLDTSGMFGGKYGI